jgi:hypothetical protein
MYQVNSDSHQELELALLESKAIALPLQQETPDYLSDRVCEAFSVSSTVSQELGVPLDDEGERKGRGQGRKNTPTRKGGYKSGFGITTATSQAN